MSDRAVGIIGLGNIGNGVAMAQAKSGRWPVFVWDYDKTKTEPFQSMENVTVSSLKDMAAAVDVLFFVVPSTKEIRLCLEGPDGIFANAKPGLAIYDLTTSYPEDSMEVCIKAKEFGITYFDAGTSGGPYKADTGQLLTMIGGDKEVFEATRKFLEPICEHIFYIGESGTGHTLKLLHNIICHVTTLATAEAGHMAESAGIPLKTMIDVFNVSNARSYSSEFRFPKHIISETWDGRSRIFNLHKDIGMGEKLAKSLDADSRYTSATLDILNKAVSIGMQDDDYTLLYRDFDKIRKADSNS
ncbi:MAG: NAD(P)-dependent oxidoreductase [Rhodospirillaceae bacterium]|jgi:3-hydroxyisobutyrate dehydrogenase|nr:NAD(P)-dependent oxidoreductase [Rhodospirillaceae bacterium]MBT6221440.1 NAD(P)-dependent oxidoreductase [Rhodospirillaceae bacterium]MBT6362769.1 NAD(P)-dependent oxidoreductase [Rhodospirillaceae bacterium]MBT7484784.1 NAD(P)-dependent oxidoreductase [Rhodospirillales bacterium]